MHLAKATVVFTIACVMFGSEVMAADRLVTVDSEYWSAAKDAVQAIEAYGGRAKIVFLPHFIIADIPNGVEARLLTTRSISAIYGGELEPGRFARYGKVSRHIVAAWNNVYMGKSEVMGLDEEPAPDRRPLVNDVVPADEPMLLLKPPGAKFYDTSEFMLGSVALGVILPESDGSIDPNSEDWTQTEQDNVTSEIISGLNWYVTKADWRPLTFYTVFHYSIPTGYEPITRPSSQDYLWTDECLAYLGYAGARGYDNALRDSLGTDWAVLALVVDSSNDADDMFSDGRFAYSSLGGPRFVMTYGNDGWGIANMDAVMAHEIGHSFYALDEYYEAGVGCTVSAGYLNVENQNSEYPYGAGGCATNKIFCIMRSVTLGAARVCYYSKGQLGWWDDDGDSITNINDTFPETELYEYTPDPCSTFTPTYAGSCWVTMLPNQNPYGKGNDITLNVISGVQYRVDEGMWQEALPNDGAFDGRREGFYFTTDPLSDTTHVIEARAFHSFGNYDTTYAVDTLTVAGNAGIAIEPTKVAVYVKTYPNPFGPRVEIRYGIPGEYGRSVTVSMRIYDIRGREVASLVEGVRSPGPGRLSWDGTYSNGSLAPSGIYFVDLVAGNSRVVKKLVLTR